MTHASPRHARSAIRRWRSIVSLVLCAAVAVAASQACSRPTAVGASDASPVALSADSPENFGAVRDFELTERSGRAVKRADLAGRVWVAGFVFTRCSGPCPKVTGTMRKLQDALAPTHAQLVSFSVDPEYDTPAVLTHYAEQFGADAERWWMLTGPDEVIDAVVPPLLPRNKREPEGSVPVGESVGHNTRLMVVDKQGQIRGFYSGETAEHVELVTARVKFLEQQP